MRLDGRDIGIELEVDIHNRFVPGLADDGWDGGVGETIHDFVDGGSHVGVFVGLFAFVT